MSDDLDLAALRRVAEAATQSVWLHEPDDGTVYQEGGMSIAFVGDPDGLMYRDAANLGHIIAFQPAVALRILARLAAAERVCKAVDRARHTDAAADWQAATDADAAWRATQQETPDAPR